MSRYIHSGASTHYILFFIDIPSRSVHIAGITTHPDSRWMMQIARNLTDIEDGFLRGTQYLILDRDTKYSAEFCAALVRDGVHLIRLPSRVALRHGHTSEVEMTRRDYDQLSQDLLRETARISSAIQARCAALPTPLPAPPQDFV